MKRFFTVSLLLIVIGVIASWIMTNVIYISCGKGDGLATPDISCPTGYTCDMRHTYLDDAGARCVFSTDVLTRFFGLSSVSL